MTIATASQRNSGTAPRPRPNLHRQRLSRQRPKHASWSWSLRKRLGKLLQTEIAFIPNAEFSAATDDEDEIVNEALRAGTDPVKSPADLPAHLKRLCEASLLDQRQEAALFRQMNLLKYRANRLRSRLDSDQPNHKAIDDIETLLAKSEEIRDLIVKANMRLVISIVKKYVTSQRSFDDMLSDGVVTLMRAVEKFDFARGFRFSTYAYRSIARNAYHSAAAAQKDEARLTRDADAWAFEQASDQPSSSISDQVWSRLRELLTSMLSQLDEREQFIIRGRYALGIHANTRTFQSMADQLGISKERVRQLEQRAVVKLRHMAGEYEMDELFAAAMV